MSIFIDLFLILTFIISTFFCMIEPLKMNIDLSLMFITCSIIACILYSLIKYDKKKMIRYFLIGILILIIFTLPTLYEGFSKVINTILLTYGAHSQFKFSAVFITSHKPTVLACNYFMIVIAIPFIYSTVKAIIRRKGLFIPFILSFIYVMIPLLFNIEGKRIYLIIYLSISVTLLMVKVIRKQTSQTARSIPLIIFVLVFASIQGIQYYYPTKTYQRDPVIEQMRVNLSQKGVDFILDIFNKQNIGRSDLNTANNRYYTGKTDLTIEAPTPTDALLKGVSYMNYGNNEWTNPQKDLNITTRENQELLSVGEIIEKKYSAFIFTKKEMTIQNTSSLNDYMYVPYYLATDNYFAGEIQQGFYLEAKEPGYRITYNELEIPPVDLKAKAGNDYTRFVDSHYLQIPGETRTFLLGYLGDQVDTNASQDEQVKQIVNIVENCADYTLLPGSLPNNKEFIEYFLTENKKGYCVHFATTATMMLRAIGIPARYVEGYSLNSSDFKDRTAFVKDNQAHAWVEVYYQYFGWVPYDVTPPAYYQSTPEEIPNNPDLPEINDQPQINQPNQNQPTNNEIVNTVSPQQTNWYYLLAIPVILMVYGLYLYLFKRYLHSNFKNKNVLRYYRLLSKLTKDIQPDIYQLALKARFSNHPITDLEIQQIETYYKQTLKQIKKESTLIKKLWITLVYL